MSIPVKVVGGYLGAGKTTYINRMLAASGDQRLVVMVNDFGEINIDARLIVHQTADIIELTNGCVCCRVQDDLGAAFESLSTTIDSINGVVLETSGVSDPRRVGTIADTWPGFYLESVVVMVNAVDLKKLLLDKYVGTYVKQQIQQADEIVLTRIDHLSSGEKSHLDDLIKSCLQGQKQSEHPSFFSETLQIKTPLKKAQFNDWLVQLPSSVYRVKGFVRFADEPDVSYLVQKTGSEVSFSQFNQKVVDPELVIVSTEPVSKKDMLTTDIRI